MRGVILASVFLFVNCFCAVLSVELIREQSPKDFLKFIASRKSRKLQNFKRRVRRDVDDPDHPDVFNVNIKEGACNNPALEKEHEIQKAYVSTSCKI